MPAVRRHTLPAAAAALTIIAAALSACSPTPAQLPSSWVLKTPGHAMITQWTETSGAVTGTVDESYKDPAGAPRIKSDHGGLSGTISNGKITLTTSGGKTIAGTIDANTLHLSIPDGATLSQVDLQPGSPDDYNRAVADVKTGIADDAQKAAAVQAASDAATALKKYQDSLTFVGTSATAVSSAQGAAGTARDTVVAAKGAFLDYTSQVLAGTCWNDAQMSRAEELFSAISAAYGPAIDKLEALKKADADLDSSLTGVGAANAAVVTANGSLPVSAQVKIPDDGGVVVKGSAALDQGKAAESSMRGEVEAALGDTGKVIKGFPSSKYCS